MKPISIFILVSVLVVGLHSCDYLKSQEKALVDSLVATSDSVLGVTQIKFDEAEFNFGDIKEGDTAKHVFEFTNVGTSPLKIESAKPSCGCTTPDITKDIIAPGGRGKMTVMFNSNGRPGDFNKSVNVLANTNPEVTEIRIKGHVIPKPESIEGPFIKK
ncbi:MAG: DUF1573 domain-containing protein [Cytophagaceae bacterium]|jgi:hypothetical protein|nr:DUF1573 domain-containing protein [Cytophagaceae bacterium]